MLRKIREFKDREMSKSELLYSALKRSWSFYQNENVTMSAE